jgi:D-alanyl-D-alanine carboxypeptidase
MSLGFVRPSGRLAVAGLLATLGMLAASWDAQARTARKQTQTQPRAVQAQTSRANYADIVVDDKTGQVLHEVNADEPRHPASLAKVMTLYLLFEQLEAGKLKLDTPLEVSAHAALQRPVKLGLKPKQTIKVEDAIKALVTKSANDAAAVVSEAIGGTEEEFAKLMTLKARMLGMTSTTYINASGLPAADQITTARDQAVLGRAIQHRFPFYYRYFATPSFQYRGAEIRNHNHLLGQVKGVDGIKTGYTDASGYNLTSSVRRDERHIVAVVMGGSSNGARDARMRHLIEEHISQASKERTAPVIVEPPAQVAAPVEEAAPATPPSPVAGGAAVDEAVKKVNAGQEQGSKPPAAKAAATSKSPPRRPRPASSKDKAATLSGADAAAAATQPRHIQVGPSGQPH